MAKILSDGNKKNLNKLEITLHKKGDIMEKRGDIRKMAVSVDGKKIKVDLLNGVRAKNIPRKFTGSHAA